MSDRAISILRRHGETVGQCIERLAVRWAGTDAPPRLIEAMLYSLRAGGKRLRPALVLCSFEAVGGGQADKPSAEAAALAIELVHTFSLVHDDLPAMDNDDLRRGMPTNHKVYGEAMAILAGDAMLSAAFEVLAELGGETGVVLVRELATATGPAGMVGGQVLDIAAEGSTLTAEELARVHRLKTGALLRAACRLGALAAGASGKPLEAVSRFGGHIGLAFQIVDDILDVTSTAEQMGKATGKDRAAGKNTYPSLFGLDESRRLAEQQLEQAVAALHPLGSAADDLAELATFVVHRDR